MQGLQRAAIFSLATFFVWLNSAHAQVRISADRSQIHELFERGTQLSNLDVAQLLDASRASMNQQTFRVTPLPTTGAGKTTILIQMGAVGWPRRLQYSSESQAGFFEYTGQEAHLCRGTPVSGEFTIAYATVHDGLNPVDLPPSLRDGFVPDGEGGRIKVVARVRSFQDLLAPVFDMYNADQFVSVGHWETVDGHIARPLIAVHRPRPGEYFSTVIGSTEEDWLWIDVETLLIVRWEIRDSGRPTDYGYVFKHDTTLDIRPPRIPSELKLPTCIN